MKFIENLNEAKKNDISNGNKTEIEIQDEVESLKEGLGNEQVAIFDHIYNHFTRLGPWHRRKKVFKTIIDPGSGRTWH